MELRLKQVTQRLHQTEKSLANIYLLEQQDLKEKVFCVDNLSQNNCHGMDNSMDEIGWNSSYVSEPSTITDVLGMTFQDTNMVSSTPKKHKKISNNPIRNIYQEKLETLQGELKVQDQILREAEERYEKAQKHTADANSAKENLQKTVDKLTAEIKQIKQKNSFEKEDTRKHFETYKRNIKEKCHLLENKILDLNKERDDLLQKGCEFESTQMKHEMKMRKIQEKYDQEVQEKHSLIDENALLKRELKSASFKASVIESTSSALENVRQENCYLQYEMKLKSQQIKDNAAEKETIKEVLREFLRVIKDESTSNNKENLPLNATQLEANDSGILSWKQDCQQPPSKVQSEFEALLHISIPTACSSLLADIQNKIADKDTKIEQLMHSNEERSKEEILQADNYREGQKKITELSERNNYLSEKLNQMKETFQSTKYQLAESEAKSENLDFCISQRNTQFVELQEELNKKENNIFQLETKLRNKSHELVVLDAKLNERMKDFNDQFTKYQHYEDELRSCEAKLDQTQAECNNYRQEMLAIKKENENDLQLYLKQFKDKDKLIESMQQKSDEQHQVIEDLLKQVDSLTGEVLTKSENIKNLQYKDQENTQKIINTNEELESTLKQLDFQTAANKNYVNQTEKTIERLKAQINCCVKDAEKNNNQFREQLTLKDSKEQSLINQIRLLECSLREKEQKHDNLHQSYQDNQSMLEKSYEIISHLKKSQVSTLKEISKHEKHVVIERSKRMELELTLKNKCDQLQEVSKESDANINTLKRTVHDLQQAKDRLTEHNNNITTQLQNEVKVANDITTQVKILQQQLKKKTEEFQQLANSVTEMKEHGKFQEEQIALKDKENNNLHQVVAALQAKISSQHSEKKENKSNIEHLEYNLKAKEELLDDSRDAMRKLQTELHLKKDENENLQSTIKEQHQQLEERTQKVTELIKSMSDYRAEMENRLKDSHNLLEHEQNDMRNKEEQIAQLKEQYQKITEELQSKTQLLEAKYQKCHNFELELASKNAFIENSLATIKNQNLKEKELVEYKAELTQELRLAREQLQNQTTDFMLVRTQQTKLRHENDKLQEKTDIFSASLDTKQAEIAKLTEDLNILRLSKIKSESKLSTDIKQIQQELKMEQQTHSMELERLKQTNAFLKKNKVEITAQLNESNKKHLKASTQHEQDASSLKASIHLLKEELKVQKETITSANEAIVLKDIEISKLKSELVNFEKFLLSLKYLQLDQNKIPQLPNQMIHDANRFQAETESTMSSETNKEIAAIFDQAQTNVTNVPKSQLGNSVLYKFIEKSAEAIKSLDVKQHAEGRDIDRHKYMTLLQERINTNTILQQQVDRQLQDLQQTSRNKPKTEL
ncbi:coiled-coil domain-containing protein 18-like [Argonauta hians]